MEPVAYAAMVTAAVHCFSHDSTNQESDDRNNMPGSSSESEDDQEENRSQEDGEDDEEEEDRKERNGDVVTKQPKETQELREWHDGLCSCHKDVLNCFFVACCPICATGYELYKHGENPILGCCLNEVLMAFVSQYRAKNSIRGSLCTDCLTSHFCGCCTLCRLHRDYKKLNK
ncbi:hypothetical protein Aperf_G00000005678 [Anoplocephala perfoliata]